MRGLLGDARHGDVWEEASPAVRGVSQKVTCQILDHAFAEGDPLARALQASLARSARLTLVRKKLHESVLRTSRRPRSVREIRIPSLSTTTQPRPIAYSNALYISSPSTRRHLLGWPSVNS